MTIFSAVNLMLVLIVTGVVVGIFWVIFDRWGDL